jgi:hypothetical protein
MLRNTKDLYGSSLAATDGPIGHVRDLYFDDRRWVVRYLVADTGPWLTGRLVLISPHALGRLDAEGKALHVNLTKAKIEHCPPIESHMPVSRQYEVEYYRYYGWPDYWSGDPMSGLGGFPMVMPALKSEGRAESQATHNRRDDRHLQGMHAVTGYHIQAIDGTIGRVTGFLVDDKTWATRDVIVEAGHWYSGKEIRIPVGKVERVSYEESTMFVTLTKADIEQTAKDDVAHAGPSKG